MDEEGETHEPRWRAFERLAQRIANDLLSERAEVVRDAHLMGHLSGLRRQIDVAITWTDAEGREFLTVVDCKDWRTPVDVNAVGTFASVVSDVGASAGILVCNAGFAQTVHDYARSLGLSLLNLHDAESEHWSRALSVPIVWRDLTPRVNFQLRARFEAGDSFNIDASTQVRAVENAKEFFLMELFEIPWNVGELPRQLGAKYQVDAGQVELEIEVSDAQQDLAWRTLEHCGFDYEVCGESWLGQFRPSRCRGLIDHLDSQTFLASYLPVSEIPGERGEDWHRVDNEDLVAVRPRGTVVTSEGFEVMIGSAQANRVQVRRVAD